MSEYIILEDSRTARRYSIVAEWFVFLILLYVLAESVFSHYLQGHIEARSAWWSRITPWNLYPTEMLFYIVLLIPGILIVLKGRQYGYHTSRGTGLLAGFLLVGAIQAIHGLVAGGRYKLWLTDFRQLYMMAIFVPVFCTLAPAIRFMKLAERLCRMGMLFAIYSGTVGLLVLTGTLQREFPFAPGQWSEQVLILLYLFVLTKSIINGKLEIFKLIAFAFGILAPLNKTPTASFVVLHVILFYILIFWVRYEKLTVYLRTTRAIIIIVFIIFLTAPFLARLGEGEAQRWLAQRWLKAEIPGADVTSGRLSHWKWGIDQWKGSPLFGTGLGWRRLVISPDGEFKPLHVHNIAITILYQTGLVGFFVCLSVFMIWFFRMKRFLITCADPEILWPSLAMFVFCMTIIAASLAGQSIGISYVGFAFWICLALISDAEAQNYINSLYIDNYYNQGTVLAI